MLKNLLTVFALGCTLLFPLEGWSRVGGKKGAPTPEFPSCNPETEMAFDVHRTGSIYSRDPLPQLGFCATWNPEFANNGSHCCGRLGGTTRRNRKIPCAVHRRKAAYCDEMLPEQARYIEDITSGKITNVLELIDKDLGRRGEQAFCTVNNGFLAWGRAIVPTSKNRLQLRNAARCTQFGTDGMVGMVEWLGHQVSKEYSAPEYSGVKLVVGDASAPRGGCLSGRGGRRGHLSHTNGLDVDLAFLVAKAGREAPVHFHREFDVKHNWWLLKQIFKNPYACVKVIFLDKRLIRKLRKTVKSDPEWPLYERFIRHMPSHANHYHVRIGNYPGQPGCTANAHPELEVEESMDDTDSLDAPDSMEPAAADSTSGEASDVQE